jgi:hypothetical protein
LQIGNQITTFNHVEQLLNSGLKELFFGILAEPEKAGTVPVEKLEELVKAYPQVSILRALLARAYKDTGHPDFEQKLRSASAYTSDRAVLYKVVNHPERLQAIDKSRLFTAIATIAESVAFEHAASEPVVEEPVSTHAEPATAEETIPPISDHDYLDDEEEGIVTDEYDEDKYLPVIETQIPKTEPDTDYWPSFQNTTDTLADEDEYDSAIEEETAPETEDDKAHEEEPVHEDEHTKPEGEIDDEVFDEITAIDDITIEPSPFKFVVEDGVIPRDADEASAEEDDEEDTGLVLHEAVIDEDEMPDEPERSHHHTPYYEEPRQALQSEEDRLILGNIAGADYFAFNDKFPGTEEIKAEEKAPENIPVTAQLENKVTEDDGRVSKYHDDKMPYTFMWWLDKTRREHAATYQPYAPYKNVNRQMLQADSPAELQRQYYENIFHLTTIENLDKAKAEFTSGKHEDEIIERFIKEEPQIKPPSNDKLDNENKAKKSAEDQDEMVSETLARIYMDQMLYHKAITTYKKLLLKFPEKSSYFVTQIELLERKIN